MTARIKALYCNIRIGWAQGRQEALRKALAKHCASEQRHRKALARVG